jgi:hypothetical protein
MKGWDGETVDPSLAMAPLSSTDDPLFTSLRMIETTSNPDGSATSHVIVKCTLLDIARATNLRVEDTAFALSECGLLTRVKTAEGTDDEIITISREMVETVASEWGVKKMMMELAHVLL